MTSASDKLIELTALQALGALDTQETQEVRRLLADSAEARREALRFAEVVEVLAKSLPKPPQLPVGLKARILHQAEQAKARSAFEGQLKKLAPPAQNGFAFLKEAAGANWLPLPVAGAFVKLLSFDPANDYAVVLGKLEPGARYPRHTHKHPEDIFMLSGDLHIGDEVIRAGDFHHAEAASTHGVNWSEQGCVLLAVLAKGDLLTQFEVSHQESER